MGYAIFRFALALLLTLIEWALVLSAGMLLFLQKAEGLPWRPVEWLLVGPAGAILFWWIYKMIRDVAADAIYAVNAARYRWRAIWRR
jgi:hypothetical protein